MEARSPRPTLSHAKRSRKRRAILESLTRGASRTSAASAANAARQSFYNWIDTDEAFRLQVEHAEATCIRSIDETGYACAMKALEDPRYYRFFALYAKCRAGWSEKPREALPVQKDEPQKDEQQEKKAQRQGIDAWLAKVQASMEAEEAAEAALAERVCPDTTCDGAALYEEDLPTYLASRSGDAATRPPMPHAIAAIPSHSLNGRTAPPPHDPTTSPPATPLISS